MSVVHSRQVVSPYPANARPCGVHGRRRAPAHGLATVVASLASVAGLAALLTGAASAFAAEPLHATRTRHAATHHHAGMTAAERTHASRTVHRQAGSRQAASPAEGHVVRATRANHAAKDDAARASVSKVPSGTLPVQDAVSVCIASLNRDMRNNKRYDRLIQLDRYVIRARVQHEDAVFSVVQPVPVDTTVMIKGSARVRGHWQWQPVITRCGLHNGKVVATSIEPRTAPAPLPPGEERERRPGVDYVERFTPMRHA
ncbi:hypothetical protein WM40_05425 [Robbsia andropogonis]|uniref:Uncharacterized protein n=1 Tax=Robbsia andropogonis TaxID=28092 RepID=A0A0F5K3B0_9BURK|nr:hypothetical protein [Robbsia andropogonis]KKB64374.1 hypothetical protein WM40_05425 [Robbsia andropogonis]